MQSAQDGLLSHVQNGYLHSSTWWAVDDRTVLSSWAWLPQGDKSDALSRH